MVKPRQLVFRLLCGLGGLVQGFGIVYVGLGGLVDIALPGQGGKELTHGGHGVGHLVHKGLQQGSDGRQDGLKCRGEAVLHEVK